MAGISKAERERRAAENIARDDAIPPVSGAQELALRIWEGQSPDVPVIERVSRIAAGLKAQKMSLDVELPHPDAARYMDAHR